MQVLVFGLKNMAPVSFLMVLDTDPHAHMDEFSLITSQYQSFTDADMATYHKSRTCEWQAAPGLYVWAAYEPHMLKWPFTKTLL